MNELSPSSEPERKLEQEPVDPSIISILLRDTTAARQRLFSYLQFYLTAQAGLAVLFGLVAHDSYSVVEMRKIDLVLVLSVIGLFSTFFVIAYGLLILRPGHHSQTWIADRLRRDSQGASWEEACLKRLEVLMRANDEFAKRLGWIRAGIVIQLFCGFTVFLVSLAF